MNLLTKFVGPRYMELAKAWLVLYVAFFYFAAPFLLPAISRCSHVVLACRTPTLAAYGAVGGLLGLYFTDWKVVNQFIPFYGGKYKEEPRDI